MRDSNNIESLAKLKPDYLGFIFYSKSKRYAEGVLKKEALEALPASIQKVGVFVNTDTDEVADIMQTYGLDLVQLHGNESPEQCRELKSKGYKIIKAFSVGESFDFGVLEPYKTVCDFFLFDTKCEGYGGSGKTFDWSVLKGYDNELPIFMSGGLGPDNVASVKDLNWLNIHALDLNSKFEQEPGLKNVELLKESVFSSIK